MDLTVEVMEIHISSKWQVSYLTLILHMVSHHCSSLECFK